MFGKTTQTSPSVSRAVASSKSHSSTELLGLAFTLMDTRARSPLLGALSATVTLISVASVRLGPQQIQYIFDHFFWEGPIRRLHPAHEQCPQEMFRRAIGRLPTTESALRTVFMAGFENRLNKDPVCSVALLRSAQRIES